MPNDPVATAQQRLLHSIEQAKTSLRHPSVPDPDDLTLEEALRQLQWCENKTQQAEELMEQLTHQRKALVCRVMHLAGVKSPPWDSQQSSSRRTTDRKHTSIR